ncbi:hypothetical protein [Rasiella sp. SM2506]|uniref:hypothetical protein n=1 Tax=Rasiella sp. SM2506 TaxID=3423914 RepID=UPI003D79F290
MKKFFIFLSFSLLIVFISCSKDDEQMEDSQIENSLKIVEITDVLASTANVKIAVSNTLDFIEIGICWSEGMNPRVDENLTIYSNSQGPEQIVKLFGTSPEKKYYVRAFAKTPSGILYSENTSFTTQGLCSGGVTDQDFYLRSQAEVNKVGTMGLCSVNLLTIFSDNVDDPIVDLRPLSGIKQVNYLSISNNNMLASLTGLESVINVNYLGVFGNNSLANLQGLEGLRGSLNELNISGNEKLTSLSGLENISLIVKDLDYNGSLFVTSNDSLENMEGLNGIREIFGTINISFNRIFHSLKGLDNFRKFDGEDFSIYSNGPIVNLSGLESLEVINGNFIMYDQEEFNSLTALSNVTEAKYFYFRNLDNLTNLNGIGNIDTAYTDELQFYLWQNQKLTDISAFSNFSSLGVLSIIESPVTDFTPLTNITRIRYNLSIRNVDISSLRSLSNLESAGRIFLDNLTSIENLEGLEGLRNIGMFGSSPQNGNLEIYQCKNLTNFCAIQGLFTEGTIDNDFVANSNAYNPTQQDIVDGNCSQ